MTTLILPALVGSHPLAALASFGLLRLVSEVDPTAKLRFVLQDDWIAAVELSTLSSDQELIEALASWVKSDKLDQPLTWEDDVRVKPSVYRQELEKAVAEQSVLSDFLSSLIADGAVDAQKGLVKPSAFYMVSGQQSFLGGLREILAQTRQSPEATFREAVFGPWQYKTRAHSLGWDPNAERLYALRSRAPTSEKPACIAGAVLLAFWALPMMPALSLSRRPATIGFSRVGREQQFSWPIFSVPIDLSELTSMLHVGSEGWCKPDGMSLRTGVEAVYASTRFEFGQGYAVLRPASADFPRRITR